MYMCGCVPVIHSGPFTYMWMYIYLFITKLKDLLKSQLKLQNYKTNKIKRVHAVMFQSDSPPSQCRETLALHVAILQTRNKVPSHVMCDSVVRWNSFTC